MLNKTRKTLASLLVGISLLGSAKAETFNVPMELFPTKSFQTYLDEARDGDIFNFYKPSGMNSTTSIEGDFHTDKSIAINGNGYGILGTLSFTGNSNSILDNTFIQKAYVPGVVSIQDNASLKSSNSRFASTAYTIDFNSTGNLDLSYCTFSEPQSTNTTSINLEKIVGSINISKNFIGCSHTGIRFNEESASLGRGDYVSPSLYILNNTIVSNGTSALKFETPLTSTTGEIANNSISDNAVGITNFEYAGNVGIRENNLYNNGQDYVDDPNTLNYSFNPGYTEDGTYHLQDNSPLIGRGLFIPGKTTWFPNENSVYIGAYAPTVPEPSTLTLLAGLIGLGAYKLRRKE